MHTTQTLSAELRSILGELRASGVELTMAVTAATTTGDFSGFLVPERAAAIFERAAQQSVVQQLVPQVPLGGNGVSVPVVTGRPVAGWVAEGARKPATAGSMTLKTITPTKLAAICVVSQEVVRANPGGYMDNLRDQLAEAFAIAFDRAALYDQGPDGTAGGGPFATFINSSPLTTVELGTAAASAGGVHKDFTSALQLLVDAGKRLTGFALDEQLEPMLLGAVDTTGRPLYVDLTTDATGDGLARPGRILGRRSFMGPGVADDAAAEIQGWAGDWTQAAWGVVGGISYAVSTEASVTINGSLVSLWENNLVAIRAEAEYGFLVNDLDAFVPLANAS